MKYVPKNLSRFGHRQVLKLNKNSPTILVVAGVVGLGTTAVMAAMATRKIEPILESHQKRRFELEVTASDWHTEVKQRELFVLYSQTTVELTKLYAPTIAVGTLSTVSVLSGHKILKGRHVATMAAYTGLMEQWRSYRARVEETVGPELEREIYNGAVGRYEEDPDHKGEYKLKAKYDEKLHGSFLQPFFDESNDNWTQDPTANKMFLTGVQAHMNRLLQIRGHVFLFEVYDALGLPRRSETIPTGWLYDNPDGDGYVDFGFMTDPSPQASLFRNGGERSVRLNFNIDGVIWDKI
jgi:hypothetical protein